MNYLGSASQDSSFDVATAGAGAVRVAGVTGAASFPCGSGHTNGTHNAVVVALNGLMTPSSEPALEQRSMNYGYDALQRLTNTTETAGTSHRYAYDLAGNRTQVWINVAPQPTRPYDGTRTLSYDALSRLTSASASGTTTSYPYTGDGVLASQTTHGTTTSYTQDLIAP